MELRISSVGKLRWWVLLLLLLLPLSSVSSPLLGGGDERGIPLVARVFGVRPRGLYRRGARVLARTPKKVGGDVMVAE
jgi:hypothetical protein